MLTADTSTLLFSDEAGVAWIDNTKVKVLELASDYLVHGWSPEEMAYQFPNLTLGQIHAAMAHCHDHRDEIDRQIEACRQRVDGMRLIAEDPALRDRLRILKMQR